MRHSCSKGITFTVGNFVGRARVGGVRHSLSKGRSVVVSSLTSRLKVERVRPPHHKFCLLLLITSRKGRREVAEGGKSCGSNKKVLGLHVCRG